MFRRLTSIRFQGPDNDWTGNHTIIFYRSCNLTFAGISQREKRRHTNKHKKESRSKSLFIKGIYIGHDYGHLKFSRVYIVGNKYS